MNTSFSGATRPLKTLIFNNLRRIVMKKERIIRKLRITSVAVLLLVIATAGNAQYKRPQGFQGPIKIPLVIPSNYPPLRTDMPFDVLVGYIYFDSLVRSVNVPTGQMDSVINSIGWDTLKYALNISTK